MSKEWRPVVGYEGFYDVSDIGEVRSVERVVACGKGVRVVPGSVLKPQINEWGYENVCLSKNNKKQNRQVHRIVAEAFINPCGGEQINHIDGNKRNNTTSNLEWCTGSENVKHAYENGLHPKVRPILIVETGEVCKSMSEAARRVKGNCEGIKRCLSGRNKTHKGFHFSDVPYGGTDHE